jgi:hypothetical protein
MLAACTARTRANSDRAPWCRFQLCLEQPADAGRRHPEAELGEFAADADDPSVDSPARGAVPTPEPQPAASAVRAGRASVALPAYERLMPAQKRPWSHQEHTPRRAWQVADVLACHDQAARASAARAGDAGSRVVPQHQQLDVFTSSRGGYEQACRAAPARRGRETRRPCRRSSQPAPKEGDTNIGALQRLERMSIEPEVRQLRLGRDIGDSPRAACLMSDTRSYGVRRVPPGAH